MTIELNIAGMNCQHCVSAVTRAIATVPGVETVTVDLAQGLARIEGQVDAPALIAAVMAAGYHADPL